MKVFSAEKKEETILIAPSFSVPFTVGKKLLDMLILLGPDWNGEKYMSPENFSLSFSPLYLSSFLSGGGGITLWV